MNPVPDPAPPSAPPSIPAPAAERERNFILQQGLPEPAPVSCAGQYQSLLFQPRIVAATVLAGILTQSSTLFLVLGAVLWWGALAPRLNLFDAVWNATFGARPGARRLDPAPTPRRFSQGMAGTFGLAIGVLLRVGLAPAAWVLQGAFMLAALAVGFGGFCLGSFLYHLIRGNAAFALRTLPWSRNASGPAGSPESRHSA